MKKCFLLIALFACKTGFSQFYYNDIVLNDQSTKQYQLIVKNKVKKIKVNTFDADNQPSEGFKLEQEFFNDWKKTVTTSVISSGGTSVITTTYDNGKVMKTLEYTKGVQIDIDYTYDSVGKVNTITSITVDTALKSKMTESHTWFYNKDNKAVKMLKIKNLTDTTVVDFVLDEHGNIGEEHWKNKGRELETYYYYYNDKNQLTDVVRFNRRAQKLLPDFLFEYDDAGRLSKQTQVPAGSSNYTVWIYTYNDNGLKKEDICYSKTRELLGKSEYEYSE